MKYHAPYGSTDPDASYVDKDVPGAVRGSAVPAAAIEAPQREIVNLITKSGLAPADGFQLASAVQTGKVNYAAAGGTANVLTAALDPAPASLTVGMRVTLKIATTNTGPATLNLNGLGAANIKRPAAATLQAGDLPAGGLVDLEYDGTQWQVPGLPIAVGGMSVFQASGTFVVPAGVTTIKRLRVWGGGGGGGGSYGSGSAGSGGGAGAYGEKLNIAVTPGQSIAVTVGSGGASGGASNPPTSGGNGGTSSFGSFLTVLGGAGGLPGNAAVATTPSSGGAAPTGVDLGIKGGNSGIPWLADNANPAGGAGGSSPFGGGTPSNNIGTATGWAGISPGGGANGGSLGGAGGPGAVGMALVEY